MTIPPPSGPDDTARQTLRAHLRAAQEDRHRESVAAFEQRMQRGLDGHLALQRMADELRDVKLKTRRRPKQQELFSGTPPVVRSVPGRMPVMAARQPIDPCDVCGKAGSTCAWCGTILCWQHNLNPHLAWPHATGAHLIVERYPLTTQPSGTAVAGDPVATHTVGGIEFPVVMLADDSGHLYTTKPTYTLWVPPSGVTTAGKLYVDLFNGITSGKLIELLGVWAIPKSDVAITGTLAVPIDLFRTSAVGTGGTAAAYNTGSALTAAVITPVDTANAALPAAITCRNLPTGGATIAAPWWENYIFTEETNAATYMSAYTNLLPVIANSQPWTLREGQGLLIKQGPTNTTGFAGSIGFLVYFKVF